MQSQKAWVVKLVVGVLIGLHFAPIAVYASNSYTADLERDSSQYFNVADNASLSPTGSFTLEGWFKVESQPPANYYGLIVKTGAGGNSWNLFYNSVNQIKLFTYDSGSTEYIASWNYTLTNGTWYHIAVVYDATAQDKELFINGVSQGSVGTQGSSIKDSTSQLEIGNASGSYGNPNDGAFDGAIDDVRLWNTTKTQADIEASFECELNGNETNLNAYWKLNNSILDETANNNDLTNNNSATFQSGSLPFTDACGGGGGTPEATSTPFQTIMPTDEEMQYWITVILMIIATLLGLDLIRRILARFQK